MFNKNQNKDERAIYIEKSSYTLAYQVLNYVLLADVVYRAIFLEQAAWDLLGIVIAGGLIATLYQTHYKTATRSWLKAILLSVTAALVIAIVLIVALR